jgi:hypothetical protein
VTSLAGKLSSDLLESGIGSMVMYKVRHRGVVAFTNLMRA